MIISVQKEKQTGPKTVGHRAIATVRDGRSLRGIMSADRKAFMSDTHVHQQMIGDKLGLDSKPEVFGAKDILIWWFEEKAA